MTTDPDAGRKGSMSISFRPADLAPEVAHRGDAPGQVVKGLLDEVLALYAEARRKRAFRDPVEATLFVEAVHDPRVREIATRDLAEQPSILSSVVMRVIDHRNLAPLDPPPDPLENGNRTWTWHMWELLNTWNATETLAMLDGARVYWEWAHAAHGSRIDALRAAGLLAPRDRDAEDE